ncbi:hypothetical protein KR093_007549 [Drosophila rubida]|uniref:Cytochrome c oxidase subunit 7A1, mitochondrial n=1 Tax=Drosophila rubida TaxID=30044 RepID=A0AAD4PMP0_9MUSC|nr:hypothetical protein KR093_007549 [Drosophila rubida]
MALPEGLAGKMKTFQVGFPVIAINYRPHLETFLQAVNDLPVFLKGGPADKVLFGVTAALCGVGLVSIVHMIYTMGFAKKKA